MLSRLLALSIVAALAAGCSHESAERREGPGERLQPARAMTPESLERAATVIEERLRKLGVKEATVSFEDGVLVVRPRGIRARRAFRVATSPGKLEFFDLEQALAAGPSLRPIRPRGSLVRIGCGPGIAICPGIPRTYPKRRRYYLFKLPPRLTGADLRLDGTRAGIDPETDKPIVSLEFTPAGSERFRKLTKALWVRGRFRGLRQPFAITLDREVRVVAHIDHRDSSLINGIKGKAQISGLTPLQAKELALVLQTGALPVRFVRARASR